MLHCLIDINECNVTNGGCEHNCNNTNGSFNCNCDLGYMLDGNGLNCSGKGLFSHYLAHIWYIFSVKLLYHFLIVFTDINECNTSNGGCEHSCTNTIGSFNCSCDTGYQLDGNGLNCNGKKLLKMNTLHYLACNCYIFSCT